LREAERQVGRLRRELDDDPAGLSPREAAARQRAARERQSRVKQALSRMREDEAARSERAKTRPQEEKKEVRVSTTDPEARVMRMADGGYRPAYNGQLAADSTSQIIVGVDVTSQATDHGQIGPMHEQIERRYGRSPEAMLVDGGFVALGDIDAVESRGCRIHAPVTRRPRAARPRDRRRHRFDTPATLRWKRRMRTRGAERPYRLRAATSECVNAIARNRGLEKPRVRGREKVQAVLLWYALAHNALRGLSLRAAPAQAGAARPTMRRGHLESSNFRPLARAPRASASPGPRAQSSDLPRARFLLKLLAASRHAATERGHAHGRRATTHREAA
jgi:hypothetical protein